MSNLSYGGNSMGAESMFGTSFGDQSLWS